MVTKLVECCSPSRQVGGMLILHDNTMEQVALLGGQLCNNTPEKAAILCNMLWSHDHQVPIP